MPTRALRALVFFNITRMFNVVRVIPVIVVRCHHKIDDFKNMKAIRDLSE